MLNSRRMGEIIGGCCSVSTGNCEIELCFLKDCRLLSQTLVAIITKIKFNLQKGVLQWSTLTAEQSQQRK